MANVGTQLTSTSGLHGQWCPQQIRTQIALISGSNFIDLQILSSSVEAFWVHLRSKSDPQVPLSSLNLQIPGQYVETNCV